MKAKPPIPKVVKLDPDIRDRLEHLSKLRHRSVHWMMKEAVSEYLINEEYKEKINQETLARWREAEQGRVVSHQSVSEWLDTWGTDDESEKPT